MADPNFSSPITFGRHHPLMSDATVTPEPQPSLFTRLRVVEADLHTLKTEFAGLREDHEALRTDRDEWRWRARGSGRAERPERILIDGAADLLRPPNL